MYSDLTRPPLPRRLPVGDGWRVEVRASTGSTNADVAAAAQGGAPPGLVVVAEEQTGGRGRLDRTWTSPPRAGLLFSALLSQEPSGWVPLLAGVGVARVLRDVCEIPAVLKWPNDVVVETADGVVKVAGLLAEVCPPGLVVLGCGLNVGTRTDELPPGAASVASLGGTVTDRPTLLRAVLRQWAGQVGPADYHALCSTVGRPVRVLLPGGVTVEGEAEGVDPHGRLVVDGRPFSSGDVVHLRSR